MPPGIETCTRHRMSGGGGCHLIHQPPCSQSARHPTPSLQQDRPKPGPPQRGSRSTIPPDLGPPAGGRRSQTGGWVHSRPLSSHRRLLPRVGWVDPRSKQLTEDVLEIRPRVQGGGGGWDGIREPQGRPPARTPLLCSRGRLGRGLESRGPPGTVRWILRRQARATGSKERMEINTQDEAEEVRT